MTRLVDDEIVRYATAEMAASAERNSYDAATPPGSVSAPVGIK